MTNEYAVGKDYTANGTGFTAKGEVLSEFRSLQADLNRFAQVAGFEGIAIDGILGPATLAALQRVVDAVGVKANLAPTTFSAREVDDVARYAPRIRAWLQTTASKTLDVATFRVLERGEGRDWNVRGAIAYGKGAVHDDFLGIQRELNKLAAAVGFAPLTVDGFIGPSTAAAVKRTYDAVIAKNPLFRLTLFPPPDTKEETAAYAQFILGWLRDTATKQLA